MKESLDENDLEAKNTDDEEVEHIEEKYFDEDGSEENPLRDKRQCLRSVAWDYFDVADAEQKMARCRLCHDVYSYRTTSTNLAKHLTRKHCLELKEETDDDKNRRDKRHDKHSRCWHYFINTDPERRIASCKLCHAQLSYRSSVSNLMKHVARKHTVDGSLSGDEELVLETDKSADEEFKEIEPDGDGSKWRRSSIWLYFQCVDKERGRARCLICNKRLSHLTTITNLKRHLERKHPHITLDASMDGKKVLMSSDGQLYEIEEDTSCTKQEHSDDDAENPEPMEIYLDEVEGNVIEKKQQKEKKLKHKKPKPKIVIEERNDSLSSDDEITSRKPYVRKRESADRKRESADSLDHFGTYLVSLLKQLPKDICNNLQAEFIKRVMDAQRCEAPKVVANNSYAITITQPNNVVAGDNLFVATPANVQQSKIDV